MRPTTIDVAEIGTLLLEQHAGLRRRAARCATLSEQLLHGEPVDELLEDQLVRLREAFADHNRSEELLLEPFLAASDAWGPLRVERMLEEHRAEHAVFAERICGAIAVVAAGFADLGEELEAHMAAEERTFLSPRVLADAARAADSR